ncbi:MAG: hypothetical protein LBU19_02930, partial [Treponema sp.]|nr:hypothetical protein [Treponema sp.]
MAEIKAGVRLALNDQFSPGIKNAGASVQSFSRHAIGAADKINGAFHSLAGTLGTLGLTIGIGAAVKTYIDLDERIVRIGTDIGISAARANELKRHLYAVAQDPAIKMGTDSLLEAMEAFSGKNFDAGFIEDNLRNVALVMKATGAAGEEAAAFFIESYKRGMNKDEIMKTLDDISVIGDQLRDQFSLSDFTKSFSGLEATNALLGKSAMNATDLFTAMNILGAGTKSPARAVAAFNAIVNELADPQKQELLWKAGIEVREGGIGDFRNLADILKEIAALDEGTGNFDALTRVFSTAAMDAVFAYNQFGHLAGSLENLGDSSGEIEKKAAQNAEALSSGLKNLQTAFFAFADERLTWPLEKLRDFLNFLAERPKIATAAMWGLTAAVGALAAIRIGAGITTIIANLTKIRGGKIDLTGAAGGAGIPVHVTNWGGAAGLPMREGPSLSQPGMGSLRRMRSSARRHERMPPGNSPARPGASAGIPPAGTPAGKYPAGIPPAGGGKMHQAFSAGRNALTSVTKTQMAGGAAVGGLTAAVIAIPQMMDELDAIKQDETLTNKERGKATGGAIGDAGGKIIGGAVGGAAGIAAGAAVGAAVGSVVPILGTAVGALVGAGIGALGMWAGSKAGRAIGEGIGEAVVKEDIPGALEKKHRPPDSRPDRNPPWAASAAYPITPAWETAWAPPGVPPKTLNKELPRAAAREHIPPPVYN